MKFTLIQLSDIHLKVDENSFLDKKDKLIEAVQNYTLGVDGVILLLSGDIAYSGSVKEYELAEKLISEIESHIKKYSNLEVIAISVAGNHDCDFSDKENKARENQIKFIENSGTDVIDKSVFEICLSVQDNYQNFHKKLSSASYLKYSTEIFNLYEIQIKNKTLQFFCFNTSYMSILKENSHIGKMFMPYTLIPENYFDENADLKFSVFHHPYNWLSPTNLREFRSHIEEKSDLTFTGHEHEFAKSLKSDLDGNYNYLFEGAVLQDSENTEISGFNLFQFDLATNEFLVKSYNWNTDYYKGEQINEDWKPILRGNIKINRTFDLSKTFINQLEDAGANFTHPQKTKLTLKDIYVYPNLRCVEYSDENENERLIETINSEYLIKSFKTNFKISFTGSENCGKSSLGKIAFANLYDKGFIPLLIDGHSIKKTSLNDFKKLIREKFVEQYNETDFEKYLQLSNDKTVFIIDDFDRSKFEAKYKARFLSNLCKEFKNIILLGNEFFSLEEILIEDSSDTSIDIPKFKQYEILEFGHLLRSKLINKWNCIGVDESFTDAERIRKNTVAENTINTVIGKNFVPNYPVFILTILQAIEVGNPHELKASSYGHYYNFLITKSLGRFIKSNDEFNTYFTYLSELAFRFYDKKKKNLTLDEIEEFHNYYKKEYSSRLSFNDVVANLINANVLVKYEDVFEFKYLYIFYFFVGKYISDNIPEDSIKKLITEMCGSLFKRESANIFMFLSHHSKDDFLLNEILASAKCLFSEFNIVKLENDIESINKLNQSIHKLVIKNIDVEKHREETQVKKDNKEDTEKQNERDNGKVDDETLENIKDLSELDIISKINLAFKTIEILGQILKNNSGSIKANKKLLLAEEAYLTGLRTLNLFFSFFEENSEYIVNVIKDFIIQKSIISDTTKGEETSKKIVFNMCSWYSYNFIKKISDSVGSVVV